MSDACLGTDFLKKCHQRGFQPQVVPMAICTQWKMQISTA